MTGTASNVARVNNSQAPRVSRRRFQALSDSSRSSAGTASRRWIQALKSGVYAGHIRENVTFGRNCPEIDATDAGDLSGGARDCGLQNPQSRNLYRARAHVYSFRLKYWSLLLDKSLSLYNSTINGAKNE